VRQSISYLYHPHSAKKKKIFLSPLPRLSVIIQIISTVEIIGSRIRLWCLVRGDINSFKVVIGQDNDIDDLRKIIKAEKPNALSNVDADNIILWSVNVDQSQLNEGFSIEEMLTDENKLGASEHTVGATFFNVEGTNVRVIVGVPVATGKL